MEDNYSYIGATRAPTIVGAKRAPTSVQARTESRISDELRFMTDGFADWVDRSERRRQTLFRSSFLVVAVGLCVGSAALLMPERKDTYVSGDLQCCVDDACSRVNVMMASL